MGRVSPGEPRWLWRRLMIFALILFCCWQLDLLRNAPDTRVNETIAWGYVVLIVLLAGFYTGFATGQDIAAIWATRSGLPYAPPSSPASPAVLAAAAATVAVVPAEPATPTEPGSAPG